jgi:hypothetical protein
VLFEHLKGGEALGAIRLDGYSFHPDMEAKYSRWD